MLLDNAIKVFRVAVRMGENLKPAYVTRKILYRKLGGERLNFVCKLIWALLHMTEKGKIVSH